MPEATSAAARSLIRPAARCARASRWPARRRWMRLGGGATACSRLGGYAAFTPCAGVVPLQGVAGAKPATSGRADFARAWQAGVGCAGRGDARVGGGRVRLRHSAFRSKASILPRSAAVSTVQPASATGGGGRDYAVQFSRHGAAVDVSCGPGVRQLFYFEAV